MAITMKGIFKRLKIIARISTVHKEHEIEIGLPTDVRHVSHIGLGTSDLCPSWMNEFRGLNEPSAGSVGSIEQSRQISWASLDLEQPLGELQPAEDYTDTPRGGLSKKSRTMKKARPSSPASSVRSSSWRSTASFVTACEDLGELQNALRGVA